MDVLLAREGSLLIKAAQENEMLPERLRLHQPLVMLWSEKRPAQTAQEVNWHFSEDYHGITEMNYAMHDVVVATRDANGTVYADCNDAY